MNQIYITGDTHWGCGDERKVVMLDADETDVVIVCGDFGGVFYANQRDKKILNSIEDNLPFTIAFCCGNHENFDALYKYRVEEWNGGKVHRIRKNIVHLMRGEVYTIHGKKFWAFGGGYSFDKHQRTQGYSWWPQEMPTKEEMDYGMQKLDEAGHLDFIITHTGPHSVVCDLLHYDMKYPTPEIDLNRYFELIYKTADFDHWFFGHLHLDEEREKITCLYDKIVRII